MSARPLRKASEAPVPYRSSGVTFIGIAGDGTVAQDNTVNGKRDMLASGDRLLLAWTGQYRTDIFEVDDLEAAQEALA